MSDIKKNIKLFKSRKVIIELLRDLEYNVEDYEVFSTNEIDTMNKNDQLDMLILHKTNDIKTYIKYYLPEKQKQISKCALDHIIEDLYQLIGYQIYLI